MSTNRVSPKAGYVWDHKRLPKGPNGRTLCRQCGQEVPKGRRTFCGDGCVHEWRIRTDPGYVRLEVYKRDKGVCARCGKDSKEIEIPGKEWGGRVWPYQGHRWEAHHIIAVSEGGGECGLENYETLCVLCHKAETAGLRARHAKPKALEIPEYVKQQMAGQLSLGLGETPVQKGDAAATSQEPA